MSLDVALQRIAQIQGLFAPPPSAAPVATTPSGFGQTLQAASAQPAALPSAGGTSAGQAMVALAGREVGVTEQPAGSNDSPRIAQFRQATAGAPGPGPWCAYFVSWAAREAGVPLGDAGQGFGRVDDVWAWGQRAGKTLAPGATPAPGDLIVWDEHIGLVESIDADGTVHTIEGNSSDRVARRTYGSDGGGAVGYVRLG
jgi:hypothetical protein